MAILALGAVPVFVDVDDETANIDVNEVRAATTTRTRAIMAVHLYGRCANVASLAALAEETGLWLVEDAAQAHGAMVAGRRAGTLGHVGCFSFYPTKNLGGIGDGGAVITGDAGLAKRLRLLRNYGETRKYEHEIVGLNSRLDEVQAAVLRAKLGHLDAWNKERQILAGAYAERLSSELRPPSPDAADGHVFHLYVVRTRWRDALRMALADRGVLTQVHYPIPVHQQAALRDQVYLARRLAVTERLATEVLSLPMFPGLSLAQVERVCSTVNSCLDEITKAAAPSTAA
jgi:dTDP-4-amino-4,6-dideoxygalactose transaminase